MIPPRIKNVKALDNYFLEIIYVTNEKRLYDMNNILNLKCYKNLINKAYFKSVKSVQTTVEWPNGEDIDPNELYNNSTIIN